MKKIIITTILSISLMLLSSCSNSSEKATFMSICDSDGTTTEYCECAYDQFLKYGDGERYMRALEDECYYHLY